MAWCKGWCIGTLRLSVLSAYFPLKMVHSVEKREIHEKTGSETVKIQTEIARLDVKHFIFFVNLINNFRQQKEWKFGNKIH